MTTILEVAKLAGVSKATVSRVLSGNGYVSEEKKAQVYQAIEQSGYRPNLLARSLATNKTQTLGLVVTNTLYQGTWFSELLFHAARMTEDQGRQLLLVDGKHSAEEERAAMQYLLDLRCDAIIIYPRFLTPDDMDAVINQHKQPIMVINRRLRENHSYCVYSDQQQASYHAVSTLIARGHRDIALITGSLDSPTGIQRLAGYRAALTDHNIAVDEAKIISGKWTPQSGVDAVQELLTRQVSFTALVASNDDMAIGAIKQLAVRGVKVPEQVSVIGFDDIPLAPFIQPALSSVKVPVTEMIQHTITRLIALLDGGELDTQHTFPAQLMIRDSIADGPFAR